MKRCTRNLHSYRDQDWRAVTRVLGVRDRGNPPWPTIQGGDDAAVYGYAVL